MSPLRLAWLNLVRRRVPALIALAAIALAVATSGMLLRLYIVSGARFTTLGRGVDVVVGAKAGGIDILLGSLDAEGPYPGFLPWKLFVSLRDRQPTRFEDGARSDPGYLHSVTPFVYFARYRRHRIIGTDETFLNRPGALGSPALAAGAWVTNRGDVVIGAAVAQAEGLHVGDTLQAEPWTGDAPGARQAAFPLRVAGILSRTGTIWDGALFATVDQAHEALRGADLGARSSWGAEVLHYFLINLDPAGLPALESLINGRTVGQIAEVPRERQRLAELTGAGRRLGFLMTALVLLLGGLSVAAMMVTRFDAMTVQLAVLRAIGYGRREVTAWLVWEGLILGGAACAIGGTLDALLFPRLRSLLGAALPAPETLPCPVLDSAPIWGVAVAATVLAVFIPLFRLYRQDIHGALRGV